MKKKNTFLDLFHDRFLYGEQDVDTCLYTVENAIKAIRSGLTEKELQKVCDESLSEIKQAKACRQQTFQALKEWEKENYKIKQENIEYHKTHSRFKKEV